MFILAIILKRKNAVRRTNGCSRWESSKMHKRSVRQTFETSTPGLTSVKIQRDSPNGTTQRKEETKGWGGQQPDTNFTSLMKADLFCCCSTMRNKICINLFSYESQKSPEKINKQKNPTIFIAKCAVLNSRDSRDLPCWEKKSFWRCWPASDGAFSFFDSLRLFSPVNRDRPFQAKMIKMVK